MRTKEICYLAVNNNIEALKEVPIKFLNKKFYNEIKKQKVIIFEHFAPYIEKCIHFNESYTQMYENINEIEYSKFSYIKLKDIEFFSNASLTFLESMRITNLCQLFFFVDKSEFLNMFNLRTKQQKNIYEEILTITRILQCKYLKKDPEINIDMISSENLGRTLGLSQ